jgi:hypothetical protein
MIGSERKGAALSYAAGLMWILAVTFPVVFYLTVPAQGLISHRDQE